MSNPSVTATISANDQASPRLREVLELVKKLDQTAKAFSRDSAGGSGLANNFRHATAAGAQYLTVLERIHKVQAAIGATVVGVLGAKAFHAAKQAVSDYIPYERDVRYQRAIQHFGDADMARLEKQRIDAATIYGLKPEDTLHAQQAFVTRNFSAPITEAATKQAIVLAKALNVKTDEAAKIVEGLTFGQGIHLHNSAQASREMGRQIDYAAIASKAGAMSPEDIQQFGKFGIGMSTAAGISAEQAFAAAMTLKRANVGGDESGVFMRQFAARLLAPTKQAFEAFAHMGINYADYAPQGNVSPDAIDASLRRRYGKGLSNAGKSNLAEALGDESRNVLGSREDFAAAVREAVEASGETLSKMDQKHLVDTALRQYDLSKAALKGGELFDAILQRATARDIQAILGDKQGGRASLLLGARDQYNEYREKLNHGDGFAQNIAAERMQGLAAASDRFTASLDAAEKQLVKANEGWLTSLAEGGAKAAGTLANLSENSQRALSVMAGFGALSGVAAVASTVVTTISSLTGLAASANVAAGALTRIAAGGAAGTALGAAGAATAGAGAGWAARGLGLVSRFAGPLGLAIGAGMLAYPYLNADDGIADGSEEDIARRRRFGMAQWGNQTDRGPWARRDRTQDFLRSFGVADDGADVGGWQSSITRGNVGPSQGFSDKVSSQVTVEGSVSGSAELHSNIQVTVNPSQYLESVVANAQAASRLNLNGRLGTSMQGPGDNGTKPSGGALTGTQ